MLRVEDAIRGKSGKGKTLPKKKKKVRESRVLDYEKVIERFTRLCPKYLNLSLLIAVLGLASFGVAMVYSASHYNAQYYFGNRYHFFTSQMIGLVLGIVMLAFTYFLDYKIYARMKWLVLGSAVILLLLVFVPGIGISRLGATRWIGVGGFTMQPSELAKFAFIIFAASVASQKKSGKKKIIDQRISKNSKPSWRSKIAGKADEFTSLETKEAKQLSVKQLALILAVGGGMCGLILLQPNLSIVMTLGATMFVCLFLFGIKLKHLGILILPVLVIIPVMLVAEPYRIRRLVAFVDPWATPRGEGFQLIQSLYSLGNGGLFGRGFLNSTQSHMFLPFSESDFIFSIIGEEFGLVGTLIFIFVLGFIVYNIFKVGRNCRELFGKYLCFGIGTLVFIQSALNIAVVTGSIPPTGLPLPFISFGGTSLAVFMAGIGIVLNVHKNNLRRNN